MSLGKVLAPKSISHLLVQSSALKINMPLGRCLAPRTYIMPLGRVSDPKINIMPLGGISSLKINNMPLGGVPAPRIYVMPLGGKSNFHKIK